jgi:hypothetical protein
VKKVRASIAGKNNQMYTAEEILKEHPLGETAGKKK